VSPSVVRRRPLVVSLLLVCVAATLRAGDDSARAHHNVIPPPPTPILSASAIPANGDSNPYGVAFVPEDFPTDGLLTPGDVLVSNFNDAAGVQGTGSTIVRIPQNGSPPSVFFQGPTGLGLTTALGVLKRGFVLAGSVPTTDGTCATITPGSLLIIDRHGNPVVTLTDNTLLDGPWDLTIHDGRDRAKVFVSNVLSGTVTRLDLEISHDGSSIVVESETQIASGYGTACNAAAVVVGPTGLAYDADRDLLYVASTDDNAIFAVRDAGRARNDKGRGRLVYQDQIHLHGPLALALAPNGHLITANGDAINPDASQSSEIVEFTKEGKFVGQFQVDPVPGSAFGLAVIASEDVILFAAVDDNTSILEEWSEER
jgi:hypothetical protein